MKLRILRETKKELAKKDPIMKRLIEIVEPDEIVIEDPFYALVDIVVGQQISEAAQETIMKRFVATFGTPTRAGIKQASMDELKRVGLSTMKASTILRLANSDFDFSALKTDDPDVVRKRLKAIKGIGDWTVDMFCFLCRQDPDVLSLKDLGIVNAIKRVYGIDKPDMPALKAKLSPYGSAAAAYLWASLAYDEATLQKRLKDVTQ